MPTCPGLDVGSTADVPPHTAAARRCAEKFLVARPVSKRLSIQSSPGITRRAALLLCKEGRVLSFFAKNWAVHLLLHGHGCWASRGAVHFAA